MTPLSWQRTRQWWNFARLTGLAQRSLALAIVMALGEAGCLITDSPQLAAPKRTPPLLTDLDPATYTVWRIPRRQGTPESYVSASVSFTVVSEDLQAPLAAYCILDFHGFGRPLQTLSAFVIDPGRINSPPRREKCDFTLPPQVPAGCHNITVAVSHDFVLSTKDTKDIATATWWFQVGVDSDPNPSLESCTPDSLRVDAGADAASETGGL